MRRMPWLLDNKGLQFLYKAQVRYSMEYAYLGWGDAANKHLTLHDKEQGHVVRLIRVSGAVQEPRLYSLQHHRDVAGLTVMYTVHQQRVPHLQTLRQLLRRAKVTTKAVALAPAGVQPRCRTWHQQRQFVYVGWWNALLASQPRLGGATIQQFKEFVKRVATECIICQNDTTRMGLIESNPRATSFDRSLTAITERAKSQDVDCLQIQRRLGEATKETLQAAHTIWHRKCYAK
ncbi:hypothetical protein GWK47_026670 [Chionoecetes opilio]|uniref:Uncharacterized protein n=1 Tax=Chionoecetes opilio TaxID=41210 RepID=A0A8J8WDE1_CHIOP|nr:hypothetical protein GWK47_026670 [Chionoecetes opilio]